MDICASADVDINADIDVRTDVAAQLKADLDACAQLLAEAAAELQASARAEVEEANDGCGCEEEVIVEKSKKFCEDVNVIVETLGEGESWPFITFLFVRSVGECGTPLFFFSYGSYSPAGEGEEGVMEVSSESMQRLTAS